MTSVLAANKIRRAVAPPRRARAGIEVLPGRRSLRGLPIPQGTSVGLAKIFSIFTSKQIKPDKSGVIRINDGTARFAFTVMPEHKYHDDLAAGNVWYERSGGKAEIVLRKGGTEETIDLVEIDKTGNFANPVTKERLWLRRKGEERAINIFENAPKGRSNFFMGDVFPGVTTFVKQVSIGTPVFYYSSMAFTVPHDDNMAYHDALSQDRLLFEANRYGIKAFFRSKEGKGKKCLIDQARFDSHGFILLPDGNKYKQKGQEVNIFDGKQYRISIGDLIPKFRFQYIPVRITTHKVKGRQYHEAEVRMRGIRFNLSLDRKSELREAIMSRKVFLRTGLEGVVDVVVRSKGRSMKKLGSFKFTPDGTILGQDGKPFKQKGRILKFDSKRVAEITVKIEDLVPECRILTGDVLFSETENRAHFQLNGIDYVFPRHPHSIYRSAVETGRIHYRLKGDALTIFITKKDGTNKTLGTIILPADGKPETSDLGELLPALKTVKIRMKPWEEKRNAGRSPRQVMVLQTGGLYLKVEMSDPKLVYRDDFVAGRLYLRVAQNKIRIIKKPLSGKPFVLCRATLPEAHPKYLTLNPLCPELKYKDRQEAELAYRADLAACKEKGDNRGALNSLYKLADLLPADVEIRTELRVARLFSDEPRKDDRRKISFDELERILSLGPDRILKELDLSQLHIIPWIFILISRRDNRRIACNAIYVLGEMGNNIRASMLPPSIKNELLNKILQHLATCSRDPNMTSYLEVLRVAYEKCRG